MAVWEIWQIFLDKFANFYLFKSWVVAAGLPDYSSLFRSKFLPLSLDFLTHWSTVLMATVYSALTANNRQWIPMRILFLHFKNWAAAHWFASMWWIIHFRPYKCKPLCLPSYIPQHSEAPNNLEQVLLHCHTSLYKLLLWRHYFANALHSSCNNVASNSVYIICYWMRVNNDSERMCKGSSCGLYKVFFQDFPFVSHNFGIKIWLLM